jgi:hypothetical protein
MIPPPLRYTDALVDDEICCCSCGQRCPEGQVDAADAVVPIGCGGGRRVSSCSSLTWRGPEHRGQWSIVQGAERKLGETNQ